MKRKRPWMIGSGAIIMVLAFTTVSGCGGSSNSEGASGGSQETEAKPQYNETKQMVLDILHTKEGMDTLKDIVRDPQFKKSLAINESDVQIAMQKALTDGSSHVTLMEQMRNPKFASSIAKAYKQDNEKILKDLMKDPEYQEMMLTVLKSPDYQRTLYDLMKTPEYRRQTMDIMTQALQNAEFRLLFMDMIKESIREGTEELTPSQKKATGKTAGAEGGEKKEEEGKEKKKSEEEGGGEKKEGEEGGESSQK